MLLVLKVDGGKGIRAATEENEEEWLWAWNEGSGLAGSLELGGSWQTGRSGGRNEMILEHNRLLR